MAATYSIASTLGARDSSIPQAKTEIIEDAYQPVGAQQYAMSKGLMFQVKGPDGRLMNRQFDAERWTAALPITRPHPQNG